MIFVLDRVENIVGKGENAGYQHFLLFSQCFQRAFHQGSLKVRIVWYRVKPIQPLYHFTSQKYLLHVQVFVKIINFTHTESILIRNFPIKQKQHFFFFFFFHLFNSFPYDKFYTLPN